MNVNFYRRCLDYVLFHLPFLVSCVSCWYAILLLHVADGKKSYNYSVWLTDSMITVTAPTKDHQESHGWWVTWLRVLSKTSRTRSKYCLWRPRDVPIKQNRFVLVIEVNSASIPSAVCHSSSIYDQSMNDAPAAPVSQSFFFAANSPFPQFVWLPPLKSRREASAVQQRAWQHELLRVVHCVIQETQVGFTSQVLFCLHASTNGTRLRWQYFW